MHKILLALALSLSALAPAIQTRTIPYNHSGTALEGFLALPDGQGPFPGVLVIHQWMGLTDYEKGRARQLAELGYAAMAVDVYGKDLAPKDSKEAGVLAGKYKGDRKLFRSRLKAALKALKTEKSVDSRKLAAIGYCFGGTGALEIARSGADLKGVVSFHGGLDSPRPEDGRNIRAKVLVLHGADDPYVAKKDLEALEAELKAAKVDYQFTFYSGAVHAFTQPMAGKDPSKGAAYHESADKRSWRALKDFLAEIFQ